ncbi:hypothetical protein PsorP6_004151 [Peronosclerospora sorghi]|uniref:Uncharacterized protein n=1 Tax=Peronosclerospora sorghi TaxID=230839 RepID=A0ACC0VLN0_9STRA|nr:hypothetical protein PsorP6_004151 [Peronosclerospora sorghi]
MLRLHLAKSKTYTSSWRRWLTGTSNTKTISRVRGTRDLLADESQRYREVVNTLEGTVERYGFRSIQTPLLEYTDLYLRSLGDESDIEMYTFKDNSDKNVTLRPEGTAGIYQSEVHMLNKFENAFPGVMRALVSNNLLFSLPQKLSYSGSMFRCVV